MTDKNDKPVVNSTVLQSVEDYVEKSGKFRTECASFTIPGRDSGSASALYLPYCEKQRFDFGPTLTEYRGHGVFTPPETGKRLDTMHFVMLREHFHDIHCPQPCRGYSDKNAVAPEKLEEETVRDKNVAAPEKPAGETVGSNVAGKWAKKEIMTAIVVPIALCVVGVLLGWLTPEGRRWLNLDKPQVEQPTTNTSVLPAKPEANSAPQAAPKTQPKPAAKMAPNKPPKRLEENHGTTESVTAVVKPPSVVDWRDKHNWRKYLRTGMTRTDVRQVFGEPGKMSVFGVLETWDYGHGRITFRVEVGAPDGSLYSWDEPD